MKLNIKELVALCDSKVTIVISELPPDGKVNLKAHMCFPWAKNVKFESEANFTADENGCVDLSKQKPDSGSYNYIDSMGIISSLNVTSGKFNDISQNISVDESLFIDITAESGQDKASARLERLFKLPEIKNQKINGEFIGEFFYTENNDYKTVLMIGGSGGELGANLPIASLLASHGFNVLTVAYFSEKGLPPKLAEIHLEYFEKVFAWLNNNPLTANKDIYLHCTSKGGELGFILASRYHFIKKVAAFAPHAYCFQGLNFKNVSSWTYKEQPLPYIRLKNKTLFANMIGCFIKNKPFGYTHTYMKALLGAKNKQDARIKIENAQADIIMFAGKQDNIWNANDGCAEIMETLNKNKYRYKYELHTYENAGHPFYAPYIIPAGMSSMKVAPRITFSSGGTLEGNAEALIDSWVKMIVFFKN